MPAEIRKTLLHVENTLIEGGKPAAVPLKLIAAIAVIRNPWAGRGFVEDLSGEIRDCAPGLGSLLTDMVLEAAGGGEIVEGYGKSGIVGMNGEVEHFCNTRGPANAPLMIPLMDKNDGGRRSHYLTIQTSVADAPAADEIVIALGASVGGRPHHRIGDRYQDLKELGHDLDNPAAV